MRILYGVVGEGMGHAVRSRAILEHLHAVGHDVKVVASNRGHTLLATLFPQVTEIKGLPLVYEENSVDRDGTARKILNEAPETLLANVEAYTGDVRHFDADVVISDFDSFAHLYALNHRKPLISIDNQHAIALLEHPADILVARDSRGRVAHDYTNDYTLARRIIRNKLRGARYYLITTFFFPPIQHKHQADTFLFPPILRREILDAKERATRGEHVLVYQTSASNLELLEALASLKHEFHVYGYLRADSPPPKGTPEGDDVRYAKNVLLRRFSEAGFIDDLASARAVVTGGGFTLIGEAVYLGKPIYSVPIEKHFEQIVSARYLEKLGYGEHHEQVTGEDLRAFLAREAEMATALERHEQDGNKAILAKLDSLLAAIATSG